MYWQVSTVELIIKGLFVGIIASAPMGPVGILCIRRTLCKGRIYGLVTGLGAAMSDIIYALITGLGMSFVVDFIEAKQNMFYLQLVGSAMLLLFGLYMFFSDPQRKPTPPASKNKGTLVHNFASALIITLSNPLIIFLFIALFARFAFVVPDHIGVQTLGYISIFVGAMLWWTVLTYCVNKLRTAFDDKGIKLLNRIIGGIVILASAAGFILTITGLYSLH